MARWLKTNKNRAPKSATIVIWTTLHDEPEMAFKSSSSESSDVWSYFHKEGIVDWEQVSHYIEVFKPMPRGGRSKR